MKHNKDTAQDALRVVNGRLVGPTLADPGMDKRIEEVQRRMFPTREAVIAHFHKRGILTRKGNLTKAAGG
jgi:agmatine/peptidylarginine deiminase